MSGLTFMERLQAGLPSEVCFGEKNTAYIANSFPYHAGLLRALVSITPTRTALEFKSGLPKMLIKSQTHEENLTIKMESAESTPAGWQRALGGGTLTDVPAASESLVAIPIQVEGTTVYQLPWKNLTAITVTDGAATPNTLSGSTDYYLDATNGYFGRRSTCSTVDSGELMYLTATVARPKHYKLTCGGSPSRDFYSMCVYKLLDTGLIEKWIAYKVYPKGEFEVKYDEDNFRTIVSEYHAVRDASRSLDDQLFSVEQEYENA